MDYTVMVHRDDSAFPGGGQGMPSFGVVGSYFGKPDYGP